MACSGTRNYLGKLVDAFAVGPQEKAQLPDGGLVHRAIERKLDARAPSKRVKIHTADHGVATEVSCGKPRNPCGKPL